MYFWAEVFVCRLNKAVNLLTLICSCLNFIKHSEFFRVFRLIFSAHLCIKALVNQCTFHVNSTPEKLQYFLHLMLWYGKSTPEISGRVHRMQSGS